MHLFSTKEPVRYERTDGRTRKNYNAAEYDNRITICRVIVCTITNVILARQRMLNNLIWPLTV